MIIRGLVHIDALDWSLALRSFRWKTARIEYASRLKHDDDFFAR
jgi:hypothetical protein